MVRSHKSLGHTSRKNSLSFCFLVTGTASTRARSDANFSAMASHASLGFCGLVLFLLGISQGGCRRIYVSTSHTYLWIINFSSGCLNDQGLTLILLTFALIWVQRSHLLVKSSMAWHEAGPSDTRHVSSAYSSDWVEFENL